MTLREVADRLEDLRIRRNRVRCGECSNRFTVAAVNADAIERLQLDIEIYLRQQADKAAKVPA